MGNINIQQRKFVVKAGMTVDDVKNSKEATALQKKYASAFDTDGQKGFSQKEADLFNATTFSEKADGTVTFWTRQKDGTKKGTKFDSKDNNIQFQSEDEVKPYIKQVVVKKAAKKQEGSVSFSDEKWSGQQIAKLTGDNAITDWLQDKDKVCTDGKDDGKIGLWEGTKSLVKGLIGGIPKAIVNHPLATAVTVAAGAAAAAVTGGAILPVLGAVGVATGIGMTGYGAYKAATAETDGEAKQALETLGMGVTTAALSAASADKVLEKAAEAGVKSAQVSKDAGFIEKTVQMFKAIPECLTKSKEWARFNLDIPVTTIRNKYTSITEKRYGDDIYREYFNDNIESAKLPNGTTKIYNNGFAESRLCKETYANGSSKRYNDAGEVIEEVIIKGDKTEYYKYGKLVKETFSDGTYKEYSTNVAGYVIEETLPDGTRINRYTQYRGIEKHYTKTTLKDGTYKVIDDATGKLFEEKLADGTLKTYYRKYYGLEGDLTVVTKNDKITAFDTKTGNIIQGTITKGNKTSIYEGGKLVSVREKLTNGGYKLYDGNGTFTKGKIIDGNKTSIYKGGKLVKEIFTNGAYKEYDGNGRIIEQILVYDGHKSFYREGKLIAQQFADGTKKSYYDYHNGIPGNFTKITASDGSYKIIDNSIGNIVAQKSYEEIVLERQVAARMRTIASESRSSSYSSSSSSDHSLSSIFDRKPVYEEPKQERSFSERFWSWVQGSGEPMSNSRHLGGRSGAAPSRH